MNSISNLRLCDIASPAVSTVTPDTSLAVAIQQFADQRISSLVVVEGSKPVGIVTEHDLLRLMCVGPVGSLCVRAVMSAPLLTARFDLDFSAAQLMMSNRAIRHLILVDEAGALKGVASETDFRRHLGLDLFAAIQNLNVVMDQGVELVSPERPLAFALQTMSSRRLDHLIVGREGRAEGILTERDVPRLLASQVDPAAVTVGAVMTSPLHTAGLEISVAEAARRMDEASLRHLVVVGGDGQMVGVVSQHRMLERLGIVLMEDNRSQLESRLNLVLEATGVGTWEFDHRRDVLIRSPALNSILKYPSPKTEESLSEILPRVNPEDRALMAKSFDDLKSGVVEHFSFEFRPLGGDGRQRWMNSRGWVVERDGVGVPLRSAGVVIDIDQQKNSEMQLRESEARFRGLIENIPLPLAQVNTWGKLVFINHHFQEVFGYTLDDVPNLATWWIRAYPDEQYRIWVQETWNEALRIAIETHSVIAPIEYEVCCKNGDRRIVEISGITLGDEFLATFIDVTERRQQQSLLEFSNAVLRHISIDAPLLEVLELICREIETWQPEMHCSLLLLAEGGQYLRHGAAPSMPVEYRAAVDGLRIGPLAGACGAAAFRREPVFTADIATSENWGRYGKLAVKHGLAACWSSPILNTTGAVLGTFAVYWGAPQKAVAPFTRAYVEAATRLAAIAIESAQRDTELRNIQQSLLRAEALGHLGSWTFNPVTRLSRWSDQMFTLFGRERSDGEPDFADFPQLVHPDDRSLIDATLARLLAEELPPEITYRRHPSLGPSCFLHGSFSLVRNEAGKVVGIEGAVLDVTAAKQAEERWRGQLDELRRWQQVTLGREGRVLELKREVNALLVRLAEAPRYCSALDQGMPT